MSVIARTPAGVPLDLLQNYLHGYYAGTDSSAHSFLLANPNQGGTAFPSNSNTALEYAIMAMQISTNTETTFSLGYDSSGFVTCWVHTLPTGFGNLILFPGIRLGYGNLPQIKAGATATYKADIFIALLPVRA